MLMALARQCAAGTLHVTDLPYRFSSWALDDPRNAGLWFNAQAELAAWAALQTPFWFIDIVIQPEVVSELLPQVLDWADQRARRVKDTPFGHPSWFINVFERQAEHIACLAQAGFASQADVGEDAWSKVWLELAPQAPLAAPALPMRFRLRPLAGASEVGAYVSLHQEVFGSLNMTEAWRLRTLQQPDYRPELDLVIQAPDGELAAFCVLWLEGSPLCGQVEPMGVRQKYRNMGLGKAILTSGLLALRRLGVQQIYVETDAFRDAAFALYESVGFRVKEKVLVFRKDYG
jgi:ribosomal protein S18 acetylase RimI-like enzyme